MSTDLTRSIDPQDQAAQYGVTADLGSSVWVPPHKMDPALVYRTDQRRRPQQTSSKRGRLPVIPPSASSSLTDLSNSTSRSISPSLTSEVSTNRSRGRRQTGDNRVPRSRSPSTDRHGSKKSTPRLRRHSDNFNDETRRGRTLQRLYHDLEEWRAAASAGRLDEESDVDIVMGGTEQDLEQDLEVGTLGAATGNDLTERERSFMEKPGTKVFSKKQQHKRDLSPSRGPFYLRKHWPDEDFGDDITSGQLGFTPRQRRRRSLPNQYAKMQNLDKKEQGSKVYS